MKFLKLSSGPIAGTIKPGRYRAFVVKVKIQKPLKPKQRQQEQILLLSRAYLSFAGSFLMRVFVIF
jgi:hypothetical protein